MQEPIALNSCLNKVYLTQFLYKSEQSLPILTNTENTKPRGHLNSKITNEEQTNVTKNGTKDSMSSILVLSMRTET